MKYKSMKEVFTDPSVFSKSKYKGIQENLMQVHVIGHRSKKLKELLALAVEYYCSMLMSKRMVESLDVYVIIKKKLENNYAGFCTYVDKFEGVRTFEIELSRDTTVRELFSSLAHEVVHLKQFATGELKDTMVPAHISVWKGEHIDENKVDYWDLPFEIEAYGREKGLWTRFAITMGLEKDKKFLSSKVK